MHLYLCILQAHSDAESERFSCNSAANVKTVARLKSMGDGGSSQSGSVVVMQGHAGGGVLFAKASRASRQPYR